MVRGRRFRSIGRPRLPCGYERLRLLSGATLRASLGNSPREGLAVPDTMRSHWWWRPGWEKGRSFYTWHVTFADQPSMRALAEWYAAPLSTLPMLGPVPVPWLHLTMQGIGFTHDVDPADVQAIVSAAQDRCTMFQTFTVEIGPPQVDVETVHMPVRPAKPLAEVRGAVCAAIGDVRGPRSSTGGR